MDTMQAGSGFEQASSAMHDFERRVHTHAVMSESAFIDIDRVRFVHVDHSQRRDRIELTAFSSRGECLGGDTVFNDDDLGLAETEAFRAGLLPQDGDLAGVSEDGWVIDMTLLRAYDRQADRRSTQKHIVLAHLTDMIPEGGARGFVFGQDTLSGGTLSRHW